MSFEGYVTSLYQALPGSWDFGLLFPCAALLQRRLLMLLGGIFYVNAANHV